MIYPDFNTFKQLSKHYSVVPVSIECLADELTPLALFHALYEKSQSCFLLESVEGGEHLGRYSFAGFNPHQIIKTKNQKIMVHKDGGVRTYDAADPFGAVRDELKKIQAPEMKGLPRFYGGAVGYVAYDMVRHFENLPVQAQDTLSLPDSFFMLSKDMFIFDHLKHTVQLVLNVLIDKRAPIEKIYQKACQELQSQIKRIHPCSLPLRPFAPGKKKPLPVNKPDKDSFIRGVQKAKNYIAAGDIIQVVPSRRVSCQMHEHPLEVYRALRRINPSPYMYFLRDKQTHVIGSSPEMLVRLESGRAETRPIAGTRPRYADPVQEARVEKEFLKDKKERAEHVMLVDLSRNDLGRVCRPGTVQVSDFMKVERYSHVMHLVSSVTGRLQPGKDAFDLFRASFPAGTLSGAPKIRAMEIIEELEKSRRGIYGGAVGYFSYTGNMDMAIAIRTILLQGRTAHVQAGAGIVADSVPEKEFQETQNKSAAMIAALRSAGVKI